MPNTSEKTIAKLAAEGIEKCLLKLNAVSPGTWMLEEQEASRAEIAQALKRRAAGLSRPKALKIFIPSLPPVITLLLFDASNAEHIFRCFVNEEDYLTLGHDKQEITLLEMGNILLNAMANGLLRAVKKSAIPSVPENAPLDLPSIMKDTKAGCTFATIISVKLCVERGGYRAAAELLAIIPEV